jgi:hypothetical protein
VTRIVVTGVPRSGTSWVSVILATAPHTVLVNEPDYPDYPSGDFSVEEFGVYPVLAPRAPAPWYEVMWDVAFSGGFPDQPLTRRAGKALAALPQGVRQPIVRTAARMLRRMSLPPENCVVKTVHAQFAIDWIAAQYHPIVIVVRRNLLSVIGSWLQLGFVPYAIDTSVELADHPVIKREYLEPLSVDSPAPNTPMLHQVAWHVGLLSLGLERAIARHPDWIVVSHEELCQSPLEGFRELFSRSGLSWTSAVEREFHRLNKPGSGVGPQRVARDRIDSWKATLSAEQVDEATRILQPFRDAPVTAATESPHRPPSDFLTGG